MRFGKKTRKLAAAGRRFFGERARDDGHGTSADTQEPVATDLEEMVMTPPAPEESIIAGDPTQHLLTSLGRFQRQVSRAEEGASQETWCDECMNQLIVGIEIALNESWADVKEALTDTARILQTYEDAQQAAECIPFLKDSYEILCLMVGDLIVDNVRSGVMKKWRGRYERALEELTRQGLTLVDDGTAREREESPEESNGEEENVFGSSAPFTPTKGNNIPSPEVDAFDDLIGNAVTETPENIAGDYEAPQSPAAKSDPFSPFTAENSPFSAPSPGNEGSPDETVLPSLDELLGGEPPSDAPELTLSSDFTADEAPSPKPSPIMEDNPREMGLLVSEDSPEEAAETAPLVPDVPTEPEVAVETEAPPVPEPRLTEEASAAPEPKPGSPEALLKTAQEAMAQGNVADAKVFALQLAANMARLEADQVKARNTAIEARINTNVEDITAAERSASDAEERVRALEEQRAQCQQDFEGKRQHIQQLRDDVSSVEKVVSDLDNQIAELEARRDRERECLAENQGTLDDSLVEESRIQAELDALNDEEGGARENLESVRVRVRELQERGGSHTAELEAARVELAARESAVVDIEKTIGQVGGSVESSEKSGNGDAVPHEEESVDDNVDP